VFVRHALPGERVRAVVTEGGEAAAYLRADAVDVLVPAPDRVSPPCPYAGPGRCGGCDWQHASLAAQRRLKGAVVTEALTRLAGIQRSVEVEEVPGAPAGLGWRTRVRFAVDGEGRAGLRRHRSHAIEPVARCLIAHPLVEALGVEGRRWPGTQSVQAVAAVATGESLVLPFPRPRPETGPEIVHERAAGRTWRVTGGGFWQVHPGGADTLATAVAEALDPRPGESAVDLYAGVGLFAGVVAPALGPGGRVTAVESDPTAVRDARHNLRDLRTVRVERGRADRVLDRLAGQGRLRRTDLVVLDPPRSGAGRGVVDRIARLRPRRVAYVACDPAALARDLAWLAERGYRLTGLRAFDLFPMTAHVECVVRLDRQRGGK
jgi:tRNA/tmRNA/rRNA uracil-C5-methylase (TrmA/RlmC/RlmD family)